ALMGEAAWDQALFEMTALQLADPEAPDYADPMTLAKAMEERDALPCCGANLDGTNHWFRCADRVNDPSVIWHEYLDR
ncbi:MAG TPA: hypothetical protein VLS51_09105, partial [Propionibacteriaceae bacterium]|nr:hypothetical protein [Propionibacteriaceae bacterium]